MVYLFSNEHELLLWYRWLDGYVSQIDNVEFVTKCGRKHLEIYKFYVN